MARPKKYASEAERKSARNAAARARYAAKKSLVMVGPVMGPVNLPKKQRGILYPDVYTKAGKMRKTTKSGVPRKAPVRGATKLVQFGPQNLSAAKRYQMYPETFTTSGKMRTRKVYYGPRNLSAAGRAKLAAKKPAGTRQPNAYAMFVKNNFAAVKASNPGAKPAQIMKIIGGMWKSR